MTETQQDGDSQHPIALCVCYLFNRFLYDVLEAVADKDAPLSQSVPKPLKRLGSSLVYRTVCWIFLCPKYACIALVSTPFEASW